MSSNQPSVGDDQHTELDHFKEPTQEHIHDKMIDQFNPTQKTEPKKQRGKKKAAEEADPFEALKKDVSNTYATGAALEQREINDAEGDLGQVAEESKPEAA
eukprot:EC724532.1.p1 GENE.EC724532.1~~EC724532.1.p1  ORF type:complete len:101 (+),score=21.93 EC724532.1:157-459(+)